MQWKWFAHWNAHTKSFYAWGTERGLDGKYHTIHMHRVILGLERDDPRKGDHRRNRCGIDNRRKNLRPADDNENAQNRRLPVNNTSGTKGIYWRKDSGKWAVQINFRGKRIYLGCFNTLEEAKAARLKAALELHGEFACLD